MRLVKTMKGKGTATSTKGKSAVEYDLEVWEEQISIPLMDRNASMPGMQQIRGHVRPVCCPLGEIASLEMQDGGILKVFFTDMNGSIAISG